MKCENCGAICKSYANKKFCSPKCREHSRYLRRKDTSNYKLKSKKIIQKI